MNKLNTAEKAIKQILYENSDEIDDSIHKDSWFSIAKDIHKYYISQGFKDENEESDRSDYEKMIIFLVENFTEEERENQLEHTYIDTSKESTWRREYFNLPEDTTKGTYIFFRGYYLFYNDHGKYIGYYKQSNVSYHYVEGESFNINLWKNELEENKG